MKLSHIFRTTILATTLAFGLTGYTQASNAEIIEQQFQQGLKAAEQEDYATALKFWQPLAEEGDAKVQFNLGVMYDNGWGVAQDYQQAVYWYQKAAQQGDAKAQYNLGIMYYKGRGVANDYQQAFYWSQKAAQQGYAKAQVRLGGLYYLGQGVKKDTKKARSLWQTACKQGDKLACEMLEKTKPSKKAK
ncbi:tetratricopeptide repeat protein [Ursidibacter sp. B-7004-1]